MTNRTPIPAFPQRREGALPGKQRGFTLIELIIFIVVVSIGLAGILSVINTVVKSSADPMIRKQTIAIAESLLEEILLKDYAKPSGSTVAGYPAGSRNLYDCVGDYSGYTKSSIVDLTGTGGGPAGYSISPAVDVSSSSDLTGVAALRVTVTVTGPQGSISLTGYRAKDK